MHIEHALKKELLALWENQDFFGQMWYKILIYFYRENSSFLVGSNRKWNLKVDLLDYSDLKVFSGIKRCSSFLSKYVGCV